MEPLKPPQSKHGKKTKIRHEMCWRWQKSSFIASCSFHLFSTALLLNGWPWPLKDEWTAGLMNLAYLTWVTWVQKKDIAKRTVQWAMGKTPYWISTPNNKNLKFLLWYIQLRNLQQSLVNCTLQAEVSRKELMPFTSEWTIRRWDGWCMSAPPVGLWAPPVPFGHQWPPCRGWYPGSSQIHL